MKKKPKKKQPKKRKIAKLVNRTKKTSAKSNLPVNRSKPGALKRLKGGRATGTISGLSTKAQARVVARKFVPVGDPGPKYLVEKLALLKTGQVAKRPGPGRKIAFVYKYSDGSTLPANFQGGVPGRYNNYQVTGLKALKFEKRTKAELNLFKARKVGPRWALEQRGLKSVHTSKSATLSPDYGRLKGGASSVREMVDQLLKNWKVPARGKYELKIKWSIFEDPEKLNVLEGGKTKKLRFDMGKLNKGYNDKFRKMGAYYLREDKVTRALLMKTAKTKKEKSKLKALYKRVSKPENWDQMPFGVTKDLFKIFKRVDPLGERYGRPQSPIHAYLEQQLVSLSKNRGYTVSDAKMFKRARRRKGHGKRVFIPREIKRAPYTEAEVWVQEISKPKKPKPKPKKKSKPKAKKRKVVKKK